MNGFIQAMGGAMRLLRPNVRQGDSLAIIGSTDIDDGFYAALAASGQVLGAETTIGLMTPRVAFGREAPEAINRHVMGAKVVVSAHPRTASGRLRSMKKPSE